VRRDEAGLARALLTLGLADGQVRDPKRVVLRLLEALSKVDPESDERLPVIHALALNLVEAGFPEMARQVVDANERLYRRRRAGKIYTLRRVWLEGKIAFALGELGAAEAKLNTARLAFGHAGRGYDAALSALDLAQVYARQQRRSETVWLVEDLVRTLRARRVAGEAIAALGLLKRACEKSQPPKVLLAYIETIAAIIAELQRSRSRRAAS
jgi:hypothetical protein